MACTIDSLVHEAVASLEEGASVQQAAELMAERNQGSLVVTREGQVIGLFTERDLLRRVVSAGLQPKNLTLGEVCTRDLVSASHNSSCRDAIEKMHKNVCRRLLVYRGHRFIGLVSLTDVAHAMASKGGGRDLVLNTLGAITVAVAMFVIALLLFQLPEMLQLAGRVTAP